MNGRARLHPEDETALDRLVNAFRLDTGFTAFFLQADDPQALNLARERLDASAPSFRVLEPVDPFGPQAEALAAHLRPDPEARGTQRHVLWLQRPDYDDITWSRVLSFLNVNREWVRRELPCFIVLAGPPQLHALFTRSATDFFSITHRVSLRHPLQQPPPHGRLRWLHLSHFLFRADQDWRSRPELTGLLETCSQLANDPEQRPAAVCITGDIAWSGQEQEYAAALTYFREMARTLDLPPQTNWYVVPGNHDVDRSALSLPVLTLRGSIESQERLRVFVEDQDTMRLMNAGLVNFCNFTWQLLGPPRAFRIEAPWRTDVLEREGFRIAFLQMNSAWMGGAERQGDLWLGVAQIRDLLEQALDAPLRMALVHHPPDRLHKTDAAAVNPILTAPDGIHLLLSGRYQDPPVCLRDETFPIFNAATVAGAGGPPGFQLIALDTRQHAEIRTFRHHQQQGWLADGEAADRQIPWKAAAPRTEPSIYAEGFFTRLTDRYRQASASYHGVARFIGLAENTPQTKTGIADMFVPLSLAKDGKMREDQETVTTAELATLLAGTKEEQTTRVVVLGEPGGGKSSLCRFLTVVLAGAVSLEGVSVGREQLPLLIPFRDYVAETEKQADLSLLDYLRRQADHQLGLQLPSKFLENRLERGHVILLLDGMDEVGTPEQRTRMRDRIKAFARSWPKTALLVTSRVGGYEDAPLKGTNCDDFRHLALKPFDDPTLESFISRWYAVQEIHDGALARERALDLMSRLRAAPQARELARNPLLATILALVHYYTLELPGERVKLYEKCVETLLKTWPASRGHRYTALRFEDQVTLLARLALAMQESAVITQNTEKAKREPGVADHGGLHLWRRVLIQTELATLLEPYQQDDPQPDGTAWLSFLEHASGLLMEHRTGYLGFFHRTLMEYLAALTIVRENRSPEALARRIADLAEKPGWHQVALLAVGLRADDAVMATALFQQLSGPEGEDGSLFLLECLGEETAFSAEQRETLVINLGREWLERPHWHSRNGRVVLSQILTYSRRHGKALKRWLAERLGNAGATDLPLYIVLAWGHKLLEVVEKRTDRDSRYELMAFFPGSSVGDRTAAGLAHLDALHFALKLAPDETWRQAATACLAGKVSEPLAAAFSLRALCDVNAHSALFEQQQKGLRQERNGKGLPEMIEVKPGKHTLVFRPATSVASDDLTTPSHCPPRLARDFALDFARDFALDFALDFARYFGRYSARDFARDFGRYFALDFARDFGRDFARYFGRDFALDFARDFGRYFARDFGRDFAFKTRSTNNDLLRLDTPQHSSDDPWLGLQKAGTETEVMTSVASLFSLMAGELLAGLITSHQLDRDVRISMITRRQMNRWLWLYWRNLDRACSDHLPPITEDDENATPASTSWPDSPGYQALYLALGWSQASTTWQWPYTAQWSAAMAAPPTHWLPRAQWHLCYLLATPNDSEHKRALFAAVDEGLEDTAWPEYAATLARLIGHPT